MRKVVVVGAGNAGMCAALSARETGASVTVLERAERASYGSDSYFTGGLFRLAYDDISELDSLFGDRALTVAADEDVRHYQASEFLDDWGRVTAYRCEPELAELIVSNSQDAVKWMSAWGVEFEPSIVIDQHGRVRNARPGWHGGFASAVGAGAGLMDRLLKVGESNDIDMRYGVNVIDVAPIGGGWQVTGQRPDGTREVFEASSVILAAGGFQADVEWRTRCLGPGWDLAKVRGSSLNNGAGLKAAFSNGARPHGNWSGCHAVAWSVGSGDAGRADANHVFERESYPFGITVNVAGKRFVDEGSDFGAYTYAKYGREVLGQEEQRAWQIFDATADELLTSEYRYKNPEAARVTADTLEGLATSLGRSGMNARQFIETVREYNSAIDPSAAFNPYDKDGRGTTGLAVNKTNWAKEIAVGPFSAYEVTCGITFTFGGVQIDSVARVIGYENRVIDGLYACGEMVGGLFYFNYPSGCGLTAGSVMGRIAGQGAAAS